MEELVKFKEWVKSHLTSLKDQKYGFSKNDGAYHEGKIMAFELILDKLENIKE